MNHSINPNILLDARFSQKMRGGDRCRFELANHLINSNPTNLSLLGYAHSSKYLDIDAVRSFLLCPFTPNQHPRFDFFEHWTLPAMAMAQNTHIYHATYNVLPLRRCAPIQILTVLDMAVFDFPEGYSKKFAFYMRHLLAHGIRKADHLVCISQATKDRMEHLFPGSAAKASVISVGVGEEFITIGKKNLHGDPSTKKHPLLGNNPFVLYVGNLEPKKNLSNLISGFLRAKSKKRFPHKLAIVGENLPKGPGAGLAADILQDLGSDVVFLGYLSDDILHSLYETASLVAYPSLYEGFGMPVLEGVAAGVPTLTSTVSSLPEAGGGIAWMVDPLDIDAISEGMSHCLLNNEWRTEVIKAGVAHGQTMAWSEITKSFSKLYRDLWMQYCKRIDS